MKFRDKIRQKGCCALKIISRITTQQKRLDRFNIFLRSGQEGKEEYAFSVDEAVLIQFRLRKGMELDEETIQAITYKEKFYKSYTQSINYLSYRMRTKKEIRDYLLKKEAEPAHIEEIIEKLTEEKLLDDREFAEMFVRSRINTSTKGPKMIEQELVEKGVHVSLIADALELYTRETQFEKVHKLMEKKLRQSTKHAFRNRMEQIQASLMQKGFSRDVIQEAAADFFSEKDESEEWLALEYQGEKLLRKHRAKFSGYELKNKLKEGLYRKGFSFDLIDRFIDEALEEE
jgi:regulatory protein